MNESIIAINQRHWENGLFKVNIIKPKWIVYCSVDILDSLEDQLNTYTLELGP